MTKSITGAMYMAQCLKEEGVEKVFGQCGHTNYALIDACQRHGIEYVSFRHEQQAAHAADAYYRLSKKIAVLNLHLSPGLTNGITGIATAVSDCTPMIVIAGNTQSYHHPREAHQSMRLHNDASQQDLLKPICKRVWRVDQVNWLKDIMHRAFTVALTGRPGGVFIDMPMDMFQEKVSFDPEVMRRRPNFPRAVADPQGLAEAAKLIQGAKNPVIYAGNGVNLSDATEELKEISELLGAPVATTLVAKGVFNEHSPLALGMTGIWGTRMANEACRTADVVLAVGTAFGESDCSSWDPRYCFDFSDCKLIQIDLQPEEIGKSYPVDIGLVGDAKATLKALSAELAKAPRAQADIDAQAERVAELRSSWKAELVESQGNSEKPIHPARLLKEISEVAPEDTVFCTDVGWNKNGAGQQIEVYHPGAFITSAGVATMGYAPAAAIGAKMGAPHRKVVGMVGDGGLMSVLGALTTAVELEVPVLWILFNNYCYSTIQTVGTTYFNNSYGTLFKTPDGEDYNPDFGKIAESFKIGYSKITEPEDLAEGLKAAFAKDEPYLLEVVTRGDLPMPRTGWWDIADILTGGNDK